GLRDGQPCRNAVREIPANGDRQSHRNRSRQGGQRFPAHRGGSRRRKRGGLKKPDLALSDAPPRLRLGEHRTFRLLVVIPNENVGTPDRIPTVSTDRLIG